MEQGWDPAVKKFFIKIMNSIFLGLFWLIACATAGLYFKLAYTEEGKPVAYTVLFYAGMVISLFFLLRYYYIIWKD